ncbi:MAG: alkaline phosphatase family protein [Candidatus Eiseniibacteriota bacterium]
MIRRPPSPAWPLRTLVVLGVLGALLCVSGRTPAGAQVPGELVPLDAFARGVEASAVAPIRPGPRLVVAMLFDQYRDDLLDRYRPVFGSDGLRRILDEGSRFRDCTIPYVPTLTGPGHATWLTGAPPSSHGIVANEWYEPRENRYVAAAEDRSVKPIGIEGTGEPASPQRLRVQSVADALRGATHGAGRVIAVSDKARGAVLAGGRRPNGVYWLDAASGLMQTSTYYTSALPPWAEQANIARRAKVEAARREPWTALLPPEAYLGTISADPTDAFPHSVVTGPEDTRPGTLGLQLHPFALDGLFDFAEAAVAGEGLGADEIPDLLIVSVSITDLVGHQFGPDSPEALDLAARLDRRVAAFLRVLDQRVGRGRYTISITADHGVSPAPRVARLFETGPADSVGGLGGTWLNAWIDSTLIKAAGSKATGLKAFARAVGSGLVHFDDEVLGKAGLTRRQAARILADSARTNPYLASGYPAEDLAGVRVLDAVGQKVRAGFDPYRSGDLVLVTKPYAFFGTGRTLRTSHGTPYRYDAHVPFVLWGYGIKKGTIWQPVSTVDIAPTISAILGVDSPAQAEGRVLFEAFGPKLLDR